PISYAGRTYQEGKKIDWRDGMAALGAITKFGISDNVFAADEHGSHTLNRLSRAPRFNAWMGDLIKPYCGQRVLEIGGGTGNLTGQLVPRSLYFASDINPLYVDALRGLIPDRPYLQVTTTDVTKRETFPEVPGGFDTVVCLNVVEHVDDDRAALDNIRHVLADGGRAIILVPQGPAAMGTLDEALGHQRRYTEGSLRQVAEQSGFVVKEILNFNHIGWPAWWLNGKLLKRRTFGLAQIVALNTFTPLFRRIDGYLPFPPLSLVGILEKPPSKVG
ncbi:MAG TPA: class I SAM-dependent methyltransferase, partial [Polyangia bacterium]